MYQFLEKYKIPFRKIGKFIVSTQNSRDVELEMLLEKGRDLNINLEFLSDRQILQQEPNLKFTKVLYSPETGILDSYKYMQALEGLFIDQGGHVFYRTEAVKIEKSNNGILVYLKDNTVIQADWVINSTGLDSNNLSGDKRKIHYVKGHYVKYNGSSLVSRLIYPLPDRALKSLGIHCTLDLAGTLKFGPDVLYIKEKDYSLPRGEEEIQILDKFYNQVSEYLKGVDKSKLSLDYTGIRPKLSGENEGFKDFIIEKDGGFINLLGIESPGLTSSLAIGEYVFDMIYSSSKRH